jgi:1-acyl-sn-glycerol-3-phosphate acyltransferase
MALQSGLPIVPVRVSGTREIVAADTLAINPGAVRVAVFPPVETRGKTAADIPGLMARVREAMASGTTGPG